MAVVAAELIASNSGLGYQNRARGRETSEPDVMVLGMAMIGLNRSSRWITF